MRAGRCQARSWVGSFGGVDADFFAFGDEGGDLDNEAGFHFGRLGYVRDGGPLRLGSVSTTVMSTVAGSSTLMGLLS